MFPTPPLANDDSSLSSSSSDLRVIPVRTLRTDRPNMSNKTRNLGPISRPQKVSSKPNAAANPPQTKPAKGQNILRRLTSKLRLQPEEASTNDISSTVKEQRQVALRARGLLPPRDLSEWEKARDKRHAVVLPVKKEEESAAKRIKEEWEAKNRFPSKSMGKKSPYPDTLKNPKFGPSASQPRSPVESPKEVEFPSSLPPPLPKKNIPTPAVTHVSSIPSSPSHETARVPDLLISRPRQSPALSSDESTGPTTVSTLSSKSVRRSDESKRRICAQAPVNIPLIVENPAEENVIFLVEERSKSVGKSTPRRSATTPNLRQAANAVPPKAEQGNADGRRKSLSLFRKKEAVDVPPPRQSSFLNLRRSIGSIGGNKSRSKSSLTVNANRGSFDASHLPPSPTVPVSLSSSTQPRRSIVGVGPRQALSPTIHSRGSILMETKGIEDDESRRLSEMAFLT